MIVLAFALGGCLLGLLVGAPFGYLVRRFSTRWKTWIYAVLVALPVVLYVAHYRYTLGYLARSGVESYPGLERFTLAFPIAATVLLMLALWVARMRPLSAAFFPILLGAVYWYVLIPLLYRDRPADFVGLDNIPLIWLFAQSIATCVFLAMVAWMIFPPHARRPAEISVVLFCLAAAGLLLW